MSRPRALVVTPRLPWPLDDGGRIGLWQFLKSVASSYETTLVALIDGGTRRAALPPPPEPLQFECVTIPHTPPPLPVAVLRGVMGRWPYTLARYRNAGLADALPRLVSARHPDFVLLNHLHLATYVECLTGTTVVLREHNVEYRWLERYASSIRNPAAAVYARLQAHRMRRTEAALCEKMDLVLAMHEEEAAVLLALAPRARVEVVPIGIDFGRFASPAPEQPPIVLLVGAFGWSPNAEGARRFIAEGWPRVRRRMPSARLRVVGKDLPGDVAALAIGSGAEPVGYVESIPSEFARASVLVVPLWVGAGARIKIVEALAAQLAVVSTPTGAEGLGLQPGREFLCAGSPGGLGDAAADLLDDPARAREIASAGHEKALRTFSLDAVARRTCTLVAAAVVRRAGRETGATKARAS